MTTKTFDILLRRGEVIDPSQALHGPRDVGIRDGKIAEIAEQLDAADAAHVVDAKGQYVVPGLIDLHVHVYRDHCPLSLDADELSPAGGVTTMLDAGSAGPLNFGGFRRDIVERQQTQVLALVNLSCIGLIAYQFGELMDPRYADRAGVVRTIAEHPDVAVGVKIRASRHIIGEGEQGWSHFKSAVAAARESGTWLMVHIGESPMSLPEMLEHLEEGDCITHCFKGGSQTILDAEGRLHPSVREAAARGVIFDVGHGAGSFQWEMVQSALDQGFEPTTISTDLHALNLHGPVYDMPTTMSKFLALGVPLKRVIEMATSRPARVLGRDAELGTLRVGSVADVAVLEKTSGKLLLTDSYGTRRVGETLLVAAATIRRGVLVAGGGGTRMRHLAE